jgi:hypothetical protein
MNVSDGFIIINNHAVLDLNTNMTFLSSPNNTWYQKVMAPVSTGSTVRNDMGMGFDMSVTFGFLPILINNKDIALDAGPVVGLGYYSFPGMISGYYSDLSVQDKLGLTYGIKSNLHLGQHVMFFANLMFFPGNTATVTSGLSSYSIPTNYNMLNIGIALKTDAWWW